MLAWKGWDRKRDGRLQGHVRSGPRSCLSGHTEDYVSRVGTVLILKAPGVMCEREILRTQHLGDCADESRWALHSL
jgi:hypothetical protein